jgi:hypothetical protein
MENLIPVFDYGSLNDDHKAAAEECVALAKQMNQPMLAELIKVKFQLVEPNRYDMDSSKFVQAAKEAGIYIAIQGHVKEGDTEYQLVSVNEDIRKLDKFIELLNK